MKICVHNSIKFICAQIANIRVSFCQISDIHASFFQIEDIHVSSFQLIVHHQQFRFQSLILKYLIAIIKRHKMVQFAFTLKN